MTEHSLANRFIAQARRLIVDQAPFCGYLYDSLPGRGMGVIRTGRLIIGPDTPRPTIIKALPATKLAALRRKLQRMVRDHWCCTIVEYTPEEGLSITGSGGGATDDIADRLGEPT